jgi:hypothetical protein
VLGTSMRGRGGGVFALKIPGDGPLQVKRSKVSGVSGRLAEKAETRPGSGATWTCSTCIILCKIEFLNRGVKWTSF